MVGVWGEEGRGGWLWRRLERIAELPERELFLSRPTVDDTVAMALAALCFRCTARTVLLVLNRHFERLGTRNFSHEQPMLPHHRSPAGALPIKRQFIMIVRGWSSISWGSMLSKNPDRSVRTELRRAGGAVRSAQLCR